MIPSFPYFCIRRRIVEHTSLRTRGFADFGPYFISCLIVYPILPKITLLDYELT